MARNIPCAGAQPCRRSVSDPWRRLPWCLAGDRGATRRRPPRRSQTRVSARSFTTPKSHYRLVVGALTMELAIVSRSPIALPFGFGFHPWFVRTRQTWLQAPAATVWLEDERHLPTGSASARQRSEWNFTSSRLLPAGWINNGFEGWSGAATIDWRDRDVRVVLTADARLSTYVLYSPSASADFFCFEPVSHPVDAHNLSDGRASHGLVTVAPGERVETWCRLAPVWKHRVAKSGT